MPPIATSTKSPVIKLKLPEWKAICSSAGLDSDAQIAHSLGCSASQVYRVQAGLRAPGNSFMAAILSTFPGVKFDYLFEVTR